MGVMQTTLRPISFFLFGIILLPSCGLFKKKPKVIPRNANITLSGRIQSVNKDAKFVLIRRYGPWKVGEGQVVESRGGGRTASLMPTGEKLGEHVAADIRSGEVEVGDAVYIRRIVEATKDKPAATPITPLTLTVPKTAAPAAPLPAKPTPVPPLPAAKPPVQLELPKTPEDQL